MAAPFEARQKQRAVIEFLVAEGETSLMINNRLKNVYKDNTIDYSSGSQTVRCKDPVCHFNFAKTSQNILVLCH